MADARQQFVAALSADQRQQAMFAFSSNEREHWHFIPTRDIPAQRAHEQALTEPSASLAHDLLKTGLSQQGYLTATSIMELERFCGGSKDAGGGDARPGAPADATAIRCAISSPCSARRRRHGNWGWRVEGHHVSLNFTIVTGHARGRLAVVLRLQPGGSASRPEKGLGFSRPRRIRRARSWRSISAASPSGDHTRLQATSYREQFRRSIRCRPPGSPPQS